MPARVHVRKPVPGPLANFAMTVAGDGLDQLEPPIPLTPAVQAAFAAGASQVVIRGHSVAALFQQVVDRVEFARLDARQPPSSVWHQIYEFREWL